MTTEARRDPWEIQPNEPAKAFAYFAAYRDLPPAQRSLSRVLSDQDTRTGTAPNRHRTNLTSLKRWSMKWRWQDRCAHYDHYVDGLKRDRNEEAILEAAALHAKQCRLVTRAAMLPLLSVLRALSGENGLEKQREAEDAIEAMSVEERLRFLNYARAIPSWQAAEMRSLGVELELSPQATGPVSPLVEYDPLAHIARIGEVLAAMQDSATRPDADEP